MSDLKMKPCLARDALFFLLFMATSNASASTVVRCSNCSEAAMEQRAKQQGPGTWDVWVPTTGALGRYKVACGAMPQKAVSPGDGAVVSGNGGEARVCTNQVIDHLPIPADRVEAALKAAQVYSGTFGTMKVGVPIYQHDIPGSDYIGGEAIAHSYLTDINLRGRINSAVSQNAVTNSSNPLYGITVWLFAHADAALGFIDGMEMLVTIEFDDGSKVKVTIAPNRTAEYVPESAMDSDGNTLPEDNTLRSQGRWRFGSEQNVNRFRQLVSRLGGEFVGRGAFVWQSDYYDCAFDGARLVCTRHQTR